MSDDAKAHTDILRGWVDTLLPRAWRPYARLARLDRPIGTWLLLWPCWWSLALAAKGLPDPLLFVLFGIGAVVMRGAGCTLNDIVDRDFDGRVERTRTRPIPSGAVTVPQAVAFMIAQALVGLAVLLPMNGFAMAIAVASLGIVVIYPFMKRITYWPQIVLGLAFNWGALLGWASVKGELAWAAVWLYVGGIFWTLGYDTIYAHQDKADDLLIGVKSTALRLGQATRQWLVGFYGAAFLCFGAAGHLAGLGGVYWMGLVLLGGHFAWQIATVAIDDPANCLRLFRSNRDVGALLFAAIVAGGLFTP